MSDSLLVPEGDAEAEEQRLAKLRLVVARSGGEGVCACCPERIPRGEPAVSGIPGMPEEARVCVRCLAMLPEVARFLRMPLGR